MENNTIKYILQLISKCDSYPLFKIPSAYKTTGTFIKLHEVYTYLPITKRTICENMQQHSCKGYDNSIYELYLSAPGGGKSTLLKMQALSYAYMYLKEIGYNFFSEEFAEIIIANYCGDWNKIEYRGQIEHHVKKIEEICSNLGITQGALPIFIEAEDINGFEYPLDGKHIINKIVNMVMTCSYAEHANNLFDIIGNNTDKFIFIIDDISELVAQDNILFFLTNLREYVIGSSCHVVKVVLSSDYDKYMALQGNEINTIKSPQIPNMIKFPDIDNQYIINQLSVYEDDIIIKFIHNWFEPLVNIDNRYKNAEFDFNNSITVRFFKLMTSPLELTGLILASVFDRFFIQNPVKLYRCSIDLWMKWANENKYNLTDVVIQISYVAFQMIILESNNGAAIVRIDALNKYIIDARREFQKYFKQNWGYDRQSIDEYIIFLQKSHILVYKYDSYTFFNRQCQAYFIAYCINNNLIAREARKKSRYEYLDRHIYDMEMLWDTVAILLCCMDTDLKDEIIEKIINYAMKEQTNNIAYYLSILTEIACIPNLGLYMNQLEQYFLLLITNINGWNFTAKYNSHVIDVLRCCDVSEHELFVNAVLDRYETLEEENLRKKFKAIFADYVFVCIWNYDISEPNINKVLNIFNCPVSLRMLKFIYDTKNKEDICKRKFYLILEDRLTDSNIVYGEQFHNYVSWMAAMEGYAVNGKSPYDIALFLIQSKSHAKKSIAINILNIAAYLASIEVGNNVGYNIELIYGKERIIADFIKSGMTDCDNLEYRSTSFKTYLNFLSVDLDYYNISALVNYIQDEHIMSFCVDKLINDWKKGEEEKFFSKSSYNYEFEYLTTCPWAFTDSIRKVLKKYRKESDEIIQYTKNMLQHQSQVSLITQIESIKFLCLTDYEKNPQESFYYNMLFSFVDNHSSSLKSDYLYNFAKQIIAPEISKEEFTNRGMENNKWIYPVRYNHLLDSVYEFSSVNKD